MPKKYSSRVHIPEHILQLLQITAKIRPINRLWWRPQ